MIEKKAKAGKILAKKISENEVWITNAVTAPKTETLNDWIEFDNEILAYEYFGVKNDTTNSTEQLPI